MGNPFTKKPLMVQPLNEAGETEVHDPQLEFMYRIVRMINKSENEEKRGDEIDKEICRILSSNDEIFDSVISGKKGFNKKTVQYKTKRVKVRGLEGTLFFRICW
ncbi:MAG: hypothetical protein P4M11_11660 [Candidatus Pacebacteria bacterium]|nr:hypothetical protein [Candidatus Paceibacterota bacterium]